MQQPPEGNPDAIPSVSVFPRAISRAGIILIASGSLVWLLIVVGVAQIFWFVQRTSVGGGLCDAWVLVLPGLVSCLLIRNGVRCVRGTASDMLFSGIASIFLGVPILCLFGVFLINALWDYFAGSGGNAMSAPFRIMLGSMGAVTGLGLSTAGILSLVGRSGYRAWRSQPGFKHPDR